MFDYFKRFLAIQLFQKDVYPTAITSQVIRHSFSFMQPIVEYPMRNPCVT